MKRLSAIGAAAFLLAAAGCGPKTIAKKPVSDEDRVRAIVLAGEGDQLLREGKDHLALLKYTNATILYPYHESIFNKLAIAYSRLHRFAEAKNAIERAIGLNREYAFAYNTQGIIQLAQLDNKGAVKSFRKAIQLLPGDLSGEEDRDWAANFHLNMGYAFMQQNHFDDAMSQYQKAINLNPGVLEEGTTIRLDYPSPASTDPEVQFQFARLFASLGETDQAIHYLDRALGFGLKQLDRLLKDDAFMGVRANSGFNELLQRYGIDLRMASRNNTQD